jgi:hypothetical protein
MQWKALTLLDKLMSIIFLFDCLTGSSTGLSLGFLNLKYRTSSFPVYLPMSSKQQD